MSPPSDHEDPELALGEMPAYYHKMDRRLIILETRFDIILPTLATKTDLLELRAELRSEMATMTKWMATIAISMLLGFAAVTAALLTNARPGG
jgi:hypothetical protein